jgi:hypothetical protein
LHEVPQQQKMDVCAKNKMANVGSLRHRLCDLGISQPSQRDMRGDFARYSKVGEVDAKSAGSGELVLTSMDALLYKD